VTDFPLEMPVMSMRKVRKVKLKTPVRRMVARRRAAAHLDS
jgi:hypothetical protein